MKGSAVLLHSTQPTDPSRAHDEAIARAALEAQRALLGTIARRISPAAVRDIKNDEGWRGPAKWAFDLSAAALLGELARAAETLHAAERLTEAALYELEHRV
jgi:hypothetical protein